MVKAASAYLLLDAKPLLDLKYNSPWHVLESQQTIHNSDAEGSLMIYPCHSAYSATLKICTGMWKVGLKMCNGDRRFYSLTIHELVQIKTISHLPTPITHTHTHIISSNSPSNSGTLQKLEQITPLCAYSSFDCCNIQLGFQVAYCAHSTLWDRAQCTTHGDYYRSLPRPACGWSPLRIRLQWFPSSPQHSKHPFPPPITAVNHSDSAVHNLSQ